MAKTQLLSRESPSEGAASSAAAASAGPRNSPTRATMGEPFSSSPASSSSCDWVVSVMRLRRDHFAMSTAWFAHTSKLFSTEPHSLSFSSPSRLVERVSVNAASSAPVAASQSCTRTAA